MVPMAQWAVIIPADRWATRQPDTLTMAETSVSETSGAAAGDDVVLVVGDEAVALGRFTSAAEIAYFREKPVPADDLKLTQPVTALDPEVFARIRAQLGERPGQRASWLVSVAMPIEAASPAEAVRQFWSYVNELGPAELPVFVWPSHDELAMQAFVQDAEANQDPEED